MISKSVKAKRRRNANFYGVVKNIHVLYSIESRPSSRATGRYSKWTWTVIVTHHNGRVEQFAFDPQDFQMGYNFALSEVRRRLTGR